MDLPSIPTFIEEIQKTLRPAIVLSNNAANLALKRVQVVPITSKRHQVYPGETLIELKGEKRKAITSQLATASKLRFGSKLRESRAEDMARVQGLP